MGLSRETALSVIRISTGPTTTAAHIDALLSVFREDIPPLLSISKGHGA